MALSRLTPLRCPRGWPYGRWMPDQRAISLDDPRADDVRALLERHLAFANEHSPPEDVHALDLDGLLQPYISFYSYRVDGELLGIGALSRSTPTTPSSSRCTRRRRRGAAAWGAMVEHLLAIARARGFRRVSLETGMPAVFALARAPTPGVGLRGVRALRRLLRKSVGACA